MSEVAALVEQQPRHELALVTQPRLDQHPAVVYLARLSYGSRQSMKSALNACADMLSGGRCDMMTLAWHRLTYAHTVALRSALAERYSINGANQRLTAVRSVLKECWRLGMMSAEEYQRAADLPYVKGEVVPKGRGLTQGELRALFRVCAEDPKAHGIRDAALFATMYGGGLRRREAANLRPANYDRETGALHVVRGKGRKDRLVYLTGGAAAAMDAWLRLRGDADGPIFCFVDKGGNVRPNGSGYSVIQEVITKRMAQAGVPYFSSHDFRRSFISDLLEAGEELVTVSKLAGHANPQTTARYDRRGEETKKRAAARLHVPYQPRA